MMPAKEQTIDELVQRNRQLEHDIKQHQQIETELIEANALAEEANKAKSEFFATMSHELRTPLNGIIGCTEVLHYLKDNDTEKRQKLTRMVQSSASVLLALVNDVLDLSKIDAGEMQLDFVPTDMRQLLIEITDSLHMQAEEKEIVLEFDCPNSFPVMLADPIRLRQILFNLVGNAVKFTDDGGVSVSVLQKAKHQDRVDLRVEIKDTGVGMDKEMIAELFDHFFQTDGKMNRDYGGTGMGLVLCHKLVTMMGGTIGVSSTLGEGSVFWFEFSAEISG